jgi:hypothetical protein
LLEAVELLPIGIQADREQSDAEGHGQRQLCAIVYIHGKAPMRGYPLRLTVSQDEIANNNETHW